MKIISKGNRNKVYRVKCPHCGSIIQAEHWEFHHFEGMEDEPRVELNNPCPNCHKYFSMLEWDFEKCYIGEGLYPNEKENLGLFGEDGTLKEKAINNTETNKNSLFNKIINFFKF